MMLSGALVVCSLLATLATLGEGLTVSKSGPWRRAREYVVLQQQQQVRTLHGKHTAATLTMERRDGGLAQFKQWQREAQTNRSAHDAHAAAAAAGISAAGDQPAGEAPAAARQTKTHGSDHELSAVADGVLWSAKLERRVPTGFSDDDVVAWKRATSDSAVVANISIGCGRMQNRVVTWRDGTHSCARYRLNAEQIQGEIYSFYLSRLLGIANVPPSRLSMIHPREKRWLAVSEQLAAAEWQLEKPFVLARYVDGLTPAYIPPEMRYANRSLHPSRRLLEKSEDELRELVQWSDLIVLDYVTGNVDRVVNNMFNEQWNAYVMDAPAHNLDRVAAPPASGSRQVAPGLLVFYDNESGLLHSYRLLDTYQAYHDKLLRSLCLFRAKNAAAIAKFHDAGNVGDVLWKTFATAEPEMHKLVPRLPARNEAILNKRITDVFNQIQRCSKLYGKS
ncbi:PREDICTED: extracellular serine/threonine protein kinase four-jointed-like [Priapulus caudatus]|uniref:Extracellular serine/threonine protein kinase four-jointed-like n=1 Tax=Priapulus caudatus TaxID=37621 RepID=A0ABM1DY28_PRICU|nr:PREDICTED: extracellular serine/threonine protein kinase four-jointed-like [Priapulus caudatus]XP_014664850.1 PREDICTED: extracellular serine/threonine protein kinase four-jointed-like [Priapulus caudatus]XP_014664851.1 PREDICTED: extracellular serine/threonine protein kinase four-jointed-like [Priapulus caudatus]